MTPGPIGVAMGCIRLGGAGTILGCIVGCAVECVCWLEGPRKKIGAQEGSISPAGSWEKEGDGITHRSHAPLRIRAHRPATVAAAAGLRDGLCDDAVRMAACDDTQATLATILGAILGIRGLLLLLLLLLLLQEKGLQQGR